MIYFSMGREGGGVLFTEKDSTFMLKIVEILNENIKTLVFES